MILTQKYKLQPTKHQIQTFERWLNTCRVIYNIALEERVIAYKSLGKTINRFDQYSELSELRKEFSWVSEVYSETLRDIVDRLDRAYQKFFSGSGFPKFKKKGFYSSFTFKKGVVLKKNKIRFPKIGEVKFFNSKDIQNYKTATITKEGENWFVSITYEVQQKPLTIDDNQAIGIDVGVVHHSYLSDNTFFDGNYALEKSLRKLRVLQRKFSRSKKGSKNRDKLKLSLQKLHLKIREQRKDFNHKLSSHLTSRYTMIFMENLQIKNMTKLNKTLSRRLLDNGFYQFRLQLKYKSELQGKYFAVVPPHYTSQCCPSCNHTSRENRLTQSEFLCQSCGYTANADFVGAQNILSRGTAELAKRKTQV